MTTTSPGTDSSELTAITYAAKTDIGMRREENQDSYGIIVTQSSKYYIVADGMGGVKGGAVASQLAIRIHEELLKGVPQIGVEEMTRAANAANAGVYDRGVEDPSLAGMGTTLVGLCFNGRNMYVVNVGDSRAYRVRQGKIFQLTEDHTLVTELLRSGAIKPDQVENHPVSHMLTRSLGPTPMVEVDCWKDEFGPARGDKFVLCSDGLYNMIGGDEIATIVSNNDGEDAVTKLVELANQRGGTDNITVIIISVADSFPVEAPGRTETEEVDSVTDTLELHDTLELTEGVLAEVTAELDEERGSERAGYRNGVSEHGVDAFSTDSPEIRSSVSAESLAREALSREDHPVDAVGDAEHDAYEAEPEAQSDAVPDSHLQMGTAVTEKLVVPRRGLFGHGLLPIVGIVIVSVALGIVGTLYVNSSRLVTSIPSPPPPPPSVPVQSDDEQSSGVDIVSVDAESDGVDNNVEVQPPVPGEELDAPESHVVEDLQIDQEPEESVQDQDIEDDTDTEVEIPEKDAAPLPVIEAGDLHEGSHGLSIVDLERVQKRKETLRQMIARLSEQLVSFDLPLSGDSGAALTSGSQRLDELVLELEEVKKEIDLATRRLTVWYGRRQRLQSVKEIELAKEISVASDQVKAKQAEFEQVTWLYYKELEAYQLDRDAAGEAKVRSLAVRRKAAMKDLAKAVRKAVKEEVESADRRIAELTTKRHAVEAKIESQRRDLEYVRALLSHDPVLKEQKKQELFERRTVAEAELTELMDLVPDTESFAPAQLDGQEVNDGPEEPELSVDTTEPTDATSQTENSEQ